MNTFDDTLVSGAPLGLRDFPDVSMRPCRCDSWFCPNCRTHKALKLRAWLESLCENYFKSPRLLSLTIDPKLFLNARSAYEYVRDGRYISRLMREFKIKNYVVVFEVQKNGNPHWHILFNWESGKMDYKRLHRLWQKWQIGTQIKVSAKRVNFCSPVHAIRYITKYLLKGCKWPSWVLNMERIRVFSCSRSLGAYNVRPPCDNCGDTHCERVAKKTTILQRLESCCKGVNVFRGEKFLCRLDVPWGVVKNLCECVFVEGVGWRWLLVDWDALAQLPAYYGG